MRKLFTLVASAFGFALLLAAAPGAQAQIMDPIEANIHHPFIVNNTTLPPGHWVFRIIHDSDQTAMRVSSASGKTSSDFLVRSSIDDHTPKHSELVFNRYDNREFLSKIYQGGDKTGVAIAELSNEEKDFLKHGRHATTHTEEQAK